MSLAPSQGSCERAPALRVARFARSGRLSRATASFGLLLFLSAGDPAWAESSAELGKVSDLLEQGFTIAGVATLEPALDGRARAGDIPKGMITLQAGVIYLVKGKQLAVCKYYVINSASDNNHPGSVCWEIK